MQLPKISLSMVRNLWCIHIPLGTIGLLCSPTGIYDAPLLSAGCKQAAPKIISGLPASSD